MAWNDIFQSVSRKLKTSQKVKTPARQPLIKTVPGWKLAASGIALGAVGFGGYKYLTHPSRVCQTNPSAPVCRPTSNATTSVDNCRYNPKRAECSGLQSSTGMNTLASSDQTTDACIVYPSTKEIMRESSAYKEKIQSLQAHINDYSPNNPHLNCAKSKAAQTIRNQIGIVGYGKVSNCPRHDAEVHSLQTMKNDFYVRFNALQKDRNCQSLVKALDPTPRFQASAASPSAVPERQPASAAPNFNTASTQGTK